ncbi:MAG: GNAT family N-acetyltransferase [Anaerofustis sp.]
MEQIRFVRQINREDYRKMRTLIGWVGVSERQAEIGLANSRFQIAALNEDGRTVGFGRAVSDGGFFVLIADVIVLPEYQRRGIGRRIIRRLLDDVKSTIQPGETVSISLMAAKGKEAFYEQFGFVRRPNEERGAGMSLWMTNDETLTAE